ncbi:SET domain-containing protein [Virgibacillus kekensis]|uniref:SET domain-containing protein n=1 Tax=Virgibacillus kekensis TaxID=202261 RepID=A0ABV9DM72_9BACI
MSDIYIKNTGKYGRGVFALRQFKKGELIESTPVIILPGFERRHIKKTKISEYFFNWEKNNESFAIALGYGSLYNHSYKPNAKFVNNLAKKTIDFYALTHIEEEEEIMVNYNGDPNDESKLWFEVIE